MIVNVEWTEKLLLNVQVRKGSSETYVLWRDGEDVGALQHLDLVSLGVGCDRRGAVDGRRQLPASATHPRAVLLSDDYKILYHQRALSHYRH